MAYFFPKQSHRPKLLSKHSLKKYQWKWLFFIKTCLIVLSNMNFSLIAFVNALCFDFTQSEITNYACLWLSKKEGIQPFMKIKSLSVNFFSQKVRLRSIQEN